MADRRGTERSGAPTPKDTTGRRALALFAPYRGRLTLIALAILVTSALGVVTPFLTQRVFDDALFVPGGPKLGLLAALVGAMIGIAAVSAVIGIGQTYLTTVLGNRVMQSLRDRLFAHLQRMHLGFFTSTRTGSIQSRLDNDVGGVQSVVTDTASSILGNVVTVVASVIAMVALSWQLSLVAFVLLPVFLLLQIRVGRVRRKIAARTQSSLSDMSAITQETLSVSGILLAKVFGRQDHEIARYRTENDRQTTLQIRQTMSGQSFFAVVTGFFALIPAVVYLVAGMLAARGDAGISAGTLVAFTTLQTRLLFPIVNLLRVSLDVQTSLALFGRIFEYLDLVPALQDSPGRARCPRPAPAARSSSGTCGSATPPTPGRGARPSPDRGPSRTCHCTSRPGSSPRSSGPAEPARPRCPHSSRASTTSTPGRCASTASTSGRSPSRRCRAWSGW